MIAQLAMRNFRRRMKREGLWGKVQIILFVHDEINVLCPDDMVQYVSEALRHEMEVAISPDVLRVPMPCNIDIIQRLGQAA